MTHNVDAVTQSKHRVRIVELVDPSSRSDSNENQSCIGANNQNNTSVECQNTVVLQWVNCYPLRKNQNLQILWMFIKELIFINSFSHKVRVNIISRTKEPLIHALVAEHNWQQTFLKLLQNFLIIRVFIGVNRCLNRDSRGIRLLSQ